MAAENSAKKKGDQGSLGAGDRVRDVVMHSLGLGIREKEREECEVRVGSM